MSYRRIFGPVKISILSNAESLAEDEKKYFNVKFKEERIMFSQGKSKIMEEIK